jgi:hypothetical protein
MLHIIIHPAWGYLYSTKQSNDILSKYKKKYSEYCQNYINENDTVILFTPYLDKSDKMDILSTEIPKIINNLKIESPQLNKKVFDLIIDDIHHRNNNNYNKPIKFIKNLYKKSESREKLYNNIYQYSNHVPLFYYCLNHSEEVASLVNIFNSLKDKKVNFMSFNTGQLPLVHEKIDTIFNALEGEVNIQIIGDWYNECIYSVTYQINQIAERKGNLKVNTNVLNEFCSFNNTDGGLKKHLIHNNNKDSFLSVSN